MRAKEKASARQLAANRRNAAKSTGPRTPAGKARSRWNALRHGVLSRSVIPPGLERFESREDYDAMLSALRRDLQPETALEEMLVERIATLHWRMGRLLRAEAGAIAGKRLRMERDLELAEIEADPVHNESLGEFVCLLDEPLSRRVEDLWAIIDNVERLRTAYGFEDPKWREVSDEEPLAHAHEDLRSLEQALSEERCGKAAAEEASRSIPDIDHALLLARYEASIDRETHRALSALERLQRRRQGDYVPPPIDVVVTDPEPSEP